jgi:phosphoglycolate phosphatase
LEFAGVLRGKAVMKEAMLLTDRLRKVKNIIFDMDGTLVDTSKVTVRAYQLAAIEFGLQVKEAKNIISLIGYASPEFAFKLYPEVDKDVTLKYAASVEEKEQHYMKQLGEEILYPKVKKVLQKLKLNSYYMAIASTGSINHVETALISSEIYSLFDKIKCNEPIKIDMVKEIITNGPEGDWLIVGDRQKDFEAGSENKIITIGAQYGFGSKEEMKAFDMIIEDIEDLLNIL